MQNFHNSKWQVQYQNLPGIFSAAIYPVLPVANLAFFASGSPALLYTYIINIIVEGPTLPKIAYEISKSLDFTEDFEISGFFQRLKISFEISLRISDEISTKSSRFQFGRK